MKIFNIILLSLFMTGCGTERYEKQEGEAIYWHERDRYTIAIIRNNEIKMIRIPNGHNWKIRLVQDLNKGDKPWYECRSKYSEFNGTQEGAWCDIHIESIDKLRTGDWNHGKFGRGKTHRLH